MEDRGRRTEGRGRKADFHSMNQAEVKFGGPQDDLRQDKLAFAQQARAAVIGIESMDK